MKHMTRDYPPENAMLRPHKETTLEKQQKQRQDKKQSQELNVANKYNVLQKLENKRMKRKAALEAAMNQFAKDIA